MTRKTTTANGSPIYKAMYQNLQEDYAASNKRHKALSISFATALQEKLNLEAHDRNKTEQIKELKCILIGNAETSTALNDGLKADLHKMTTIAKFFICLACFAAVLVFVAGLR